MRNFRVFLQRLAALFNRERRDRELDDEVESNLQMQIDDNLQRGMPPDEARYAALRKFGNVALVKEETRELWSLTWLEQLWQDVRFGLRQLRKNPGFTAVAVLTLALSIGAATAIFNATDQTLFSPLPLPDPQRLTAVYSFDRKTATYVSTSYPDYEDFSNRSQSFEHLSAYARFPLDLTIGQDTERVPVEAVSTDYFSMLDLPPLVGRAFAPEDSLSPSAALVAMISENLWRGRFAADSTLIGRTITLENNSFRVIGVVPELYHGANLNWGDPPQLWVPLAALPLLVPRLKQFDVFHQRDARWLVMLGRLKPGVTVVQAQSELRLLAANLATAEPATNADITVAAFSASRSKFWPAYRASVTESFAMFAFGSGLLLLLACANVANLLLERSLGRSREMGVRIALGAGRGRLTRQLMVENVLLVVIGFPLALLIIQALDTALHVFPDAFGLPLALDLHMGNRVLLFAFMLSAATVFLFGLAPALQASQPNVTPSLKESGDTPSLGSSRDWPRRSLVVAQVAFSMVLLVAGGIFARSVMKAYRVDLGFRPGHLLLMSFDLPKEKYNEGRSQLFSETALRKVSSLAGVESATVVWNLPLTIQAAMPVADAESRTPVEVQAGYNMVGPDYLRVLGIGVLAGRDFTWQDTGNSPRAVIVNQTMAERFWHVSNAVGHTILISDKPGHQVLAEVVGVADDSKYVSVWESAEPHMYLAAWQWQWPALNLIVRTRGAPEGLIHQVRHEWSMAFPGVPLYGIHSGDEHVQTSLAPERFAAGLFSSFAIVAAIVAAIGLYGIVAFSVARRRREIGIRMAIGATRGTIVRGILGSTLSLTGVGLVFGAVGACVTMHLIASQVKGVSPYDPVTFAVIALLLCAASAVASFIPALRAARMDPLRSLRSE